MKSSAVMSDTATLEKPPTMPEKPPPAVKEKPPEESRAQQLREQVASGDEPNQILRDIAGEEKTPRFIREFSKEQSAQERQQLAREIRQMRREYFEQKRALAEQQAQTQEAVRQKEPSLSETRQRLETLRGEIARLSGPWFNKLLHYTKLRGLNTDLETAEEAYAQLQQEEVIAKEAQQSLVDTKEDRSLLEEGRRRIQHFYKEEVDKWSSSDYTKEDIARYFTEEHLASLSMEDYVTLLRRFPSEMVTHVTRQGIRDHIGGDFHTAGLEEYFDNFKQLLQDGRLRSRFGVLFKDGLTKGAVAQALDLGGTIITKKNAQILLRNIVQSGQLTGGESTWADSTAIHLAAEEVANNIYGGERGNEIFFAFPSAHIAAEHSYMASLGGYRAQASVGTYHNDQWIWAKDNEGLGIDAGVIFISADARVDPKTGSKYELTADLKPIDRQDRIENVVRFLTSNHYQEIENSLREILSKSNPSIQELDGLKRRLTDEFGIEEPQLQEALLDFSPLIGGISNERILADIEQRDFDPVKAARGFLLKSGLLYKEAGTTISSRQYWEEYFAQNPNLRPKRVVYYEGGNPTEALRLWRESNGITKKSEAEDLGFPEKRITLTRATLGMNRFRSIAREAIDDYYSQPKAA